MRKLLFVSIIGLLAVFSSCDDGVESKNNFMFKETYCENPWDNIVGPEWTREQLISYYLTNQLEVVFSDISITDDGVPELCYACSCLTGDNVRISALENFSEILLEIGFEIES